MTAMFPSPVPGPSETVPLSPPEDGLTGLDHLGALADLTGRSIVDLAGFLHQIDADASTQLGVVDHVSEMAGKLSRITQEMNTGLETVSAANAQTLETVEGSVSALRASADDSRDVAGWVGQLDSALGNVETTLSEVRRANDRIAEIAKQVNILAVNARIEAARAGDMGRGFAVVAEAINSLSQETSQAASDVTGSTARSIP